MRLKRDYKKEYARYGKKLKAKRYRAKLNAIGRRLGTYGNGDNIDNAHTGRSDRTRPQHQSKNRAKKTGPKHSV